jgi:hypothetical protein
VADNPGVDDDALTALTRRMADLGADDPGMWADSELSRDIPQQDRYLVLRRIWRLPKRVLDWNNATV